MTQTDKERENLYILEEKYKEEGRKREGKLADKVKLLGYTIEGYLILNIMEES